MKEQKIFFLKLIKKDMLLSFFDKGLKASSNEMWYPTIDELYVNNFITSKFSPDISSLKILERSLISEIKELKLSLPKQLDKDTTLIDIRVKFNRLTSVHALSQNIINTVRNRASRWQCLEYNVINKSCK